ncbi:MAG: hypothetical protein RSF79_13640, partial [Janthinobacterium sp.]
MCGRQCLLPEAGIGGGRAAVAASLIGTLGIVTALIWLVVWQIRAQLEDVQARSAEAVQGLQDY